MLASSSSNSSPSHPFSANSQVSEYDPNQALLAGNRAESATGSRLGNQSSMRGDHKGRGARARAPFSQPGPTKDRSKTTVVVEQIPEESFSEEAVQDYFSQFGNIISVEMHAYKRLAIVKFDDHFAARRAYDSPKAIFDNRFVKVYWYNPDTIPTPTGKNQLHGAATAASSVAVIQEEYKQDEAMVDIEEVERRQTELQKAHEERLKKQQEAEVQRKEIEEQLKAKNEEATKLRRKLTEMTGEASTSMDADFVEKLSLLQQEAHTFGIDSEKDQITSFGRGRGAYRGRASYHSPRGRGYGSFRGAYGARGSFSGASFAGTHCRVKRLDNRPKRVAVVGEAGPEKDEALRQYLVRVSLRLGLHDADMYDIDQLRV
jgi:RNA recognition motif-containing protein